MARQLKSEPETPEAGSSPQIPNANEEANFLSHLNKLRTQQNRVAIKKAELDAERSVMNDMFNEAKGDGFKRKELQAILDDGKASVRDLVAEEERRAKLRRWAGLPAGAQPDLFGLGDGARDAVDADAEGYAMGRRGEDEVPPDWVSPAHHPDFSQGWRRAQTEMAAAYAKTPDAANDASEQEAAA
ncbi:hypothetical protein [Brevundimonas sp. Root1279]|uniref:hypothetical protein n=1 Tax=Brevundimonas sp. Root1279 TaxID=1736443 RepID=UPI0006FC293F|nr:hypothetical protein [Brevundimonas sp. Root1279]KQW79738.1 hypothetical protein ASC65_14415 [Brevundimonas sp. Root1279]